MSQCRISWYGRDILMIKPCGTNTTSTLTTQNPKEKNVGKLDRVPSKIVPRVTSARNKIQAGKVFAVKRVYITGLCKCHNCILFWGLFIFIFIIYYLFLFLFLFLCILFVNKQTNKQTDKQTNKHNHTLASSTWRDDIYNHLTVYTCILSDSHATYL